MEELLWYKNHSNSNSILMVQKCVCIILRPMGPNIISEILASQIMSKMKSSLICLSPLMRTNYFPFFEIKFQT